MAGLVMQVSGGLVEVDIFCNCLCLHDLMLAFSTPAYGTGAEDREGIRPETDSVYPSDEESWGGGSGLNLGHAQSHPLSGSGCFLSNRSQHRLGIDQTLNRDQK